MCASAHVWLTMSESPTCTAANTAGQKILTVRKNAPCLPQIEKAPPMLIMSDPKKYGNTCGDLGSIGGALEA